MSMPPRAFGDWSGHVVAVDRRGSGWIAVLDGRPLPATFESERSARAAAVAEGQRLDAVAYALLARVRRGLRRKQA